MFSKDTYIKRRAVLRELVGAAFQKPRAAADRRRHVVPVVLRAGFLRGQHGVDHRCVAGSWLGVPVAGVRPGVRVEHDDLLARGGTVQPSPQRTRGSAP